MYVCVCVCVHVRVCVCVCLHVDRSILNVFLSIYQAIESAAKYSGSNMCLLVRAYVCVCVC